MALVFLVPLSSAFPNLLLIPAGLLFIYKLILKKKVRFSLFWLLNFLLIAFILFLAFLEGNLIEEIKFFKEFLSGLFILLIISEVSNYKFIEKSFVFGSLSAVILNCINILYQLRNGLALDLSFGSAVNQLLLLERPYLAFITVLCNYIIFKWIRKTKIKKYYFLALIFFSFCFFITGRLGMILHTLLIVQHIFKSSSQFKIKHIVSLLIVFVSIGFLVLKNPYLKERLRIGDTIESTYKAYKAYEIRFIIWECSSELLKDNWLTGVNSHTQLIPELTACYVSKINPKQVKKVNYYKDEKFNTHNQYLDIWLIAGLPGLILFLIILLHPFFKAKSHHKVLTVLILFMLFFMAENVLHRQLGCFLYAVFFGLYFPKHIQWSWAK